MDAIEFEFDLTEYICPCAICTHRQSKPNGKQDCPSERECTLKKDWEMNHL